MRLQPAVSQSRDARIDVVRALALLTIFINHVPGTIFEKLTLKNFGFADAAEVFVLISGMAVALAYGPKFTSGGRLLATLKMWRRAGVLYCAHIMTTVATLTIFCASSILADRPDLLRINNIEVLFDDPAEAFVGVGVLGHQLGYNNILSMYAVLVLVAPLILAGLLRWFWPTLFVSFAVWLIAGLWQIAPPNYPTSGFWFLNPLSWQLLFTIGMAAALYARRGWALPQWLIYPSIAYLLFALVFIYSPFWGPPTWFGLPALIGGFDKTFLSLSRLLDILALGCVVASWRGFASFSASSAARPLALMGRHSLPIFIAGTVLAMIGQSLRMVLPVSLSLDILLVGTGILLQFALAWYLDWLSKLGRTPTPSVPTVALAGA